MTVNTRRLDKLFDRVDSLDRRLRKYSPDQSRDERGRWSAEGGGSGGGRGFSRAHPGADVLRRHGFKPIIGHELAFFSSKTNLTRGQLKAIDGALKRAGFALEVGSTSGMPYPASKYPKDIKNKSGTVLQLRDVD